MISVFPVHFKGNKHRSRRSGQSNSFIALQS